MFDAEHTVSRTWTPPVRTHRARCPRTCRRTSRPGTRYCGNTVRPGPSGNPVRQTRHAKAIDWFPIVGRHDVPACNTHSVTRHLRGQSRIGFGRTATDALTWPVRLPRVSYVRRRVVWYDVRCYKRTWGVVAQPYRVRRRQRGTSVHYDYETDFPDVFPSTCACCTEARHNVVMHARGHHIKTFCAPRGMCFPAFKV